MLVWERLESNGVSTSVSMYRAKVPGGWLVALDYGKEMASLSFYPDPTYKWDGSSLP